MNEWLTVVCLNNGTEYQPCFPRPAVKGCAIVEENLMICASCRSICIVISKHIHTICVRYLFDPRLNSESITAQTLQQINSTCCRTSQIHLLYLRLMLLRFNRICVAVWTESENTLVSVQVFRCEDDGDIVPYVDWTTQKAPIIIIVFGSMFLTACDFCMNLIDSLLDDSWYIFIHLSNWI